MRQRKGQAALEFLTTYAWAFLVILIMIGALAYFGVLRPSKVLPNRCTFSSEIGCMDYAIDGPANAVNLRLKNSFGEPVVMQSLNVTSGSVTPFSCSLSSPALPYIWSTDTIIDAKFVNCNIAAAGFVQGDKAKFTVDVQYYAARSSTAYNKTVSGEVYSTVG